MNGELREVHLIEFPLAVYRQAQEHADELVREFSLIALAEAEQPNPTVPARLLELVKALTDEYGGVTTEVELERDKALAAGLESIDLTYRLPPAAAEASLALGAMLDEADEFCRSGGALLTLATPPEAKRFRDWYLQEFASQLTGGKPTPWPRYADVGRPGAEPR